MKVALIGNLAGVSNDILSELRTRGVEADLFVNMAEAANTKNGFSDGLSIKESWIHIVTPPADPKSGSRVSLFIGQLQRFRFQLKLVRQLMRYDVLHSNSGSLTYPSLLYLIFVVLKRKAYLAFATGSDIREGASQASNRQGKQLRKFFCGARRVYLLNADMVALPFIASLKHAVFFPFAINEKRFSPSSQLSRPDIYEGKLLCFMMSNLDFGITDNWPGRNSMKFNDRFIRAMANYVKKEPRFHAIILDRGSDRHIARQMVADLNLNTHVTFLPSLSQTDRIRYMTMADIIVDQFHLGCFGLGALEALSMGKTLITYFNKDFISRSYADEIPILNSKTEDDVLAALEIAHNPEFRKEIGLKAREWILKHHARQIVLDRLITIYRESMEME